MAIDTKKIADTVGTYISWTLTILTLVAAMVVFSDKGYISFSVFLLAILIILPPLKDTLGRLLPFLLNRFQKYTFFTALVITAFIIAGTYEETHPKTETGPDYAARGVTVTHATDTTSTGGFGRYFAIVIGISEYDAPSIPSLKMPEKDARAFYDVLKKHYVFDSVKLMINVTKSDIMKTLMSYRKLLNANDNLVIFYAGHGYEDSKNKQGYWFPKNAQPDDPSNWISNSDIIDQLNPIPAKHKLIISDACFSGGLFTARSVGLNNAEKSVNELYSASSCTAMTSGAHTEVPDESVFLHYLLATLTSDTSKYKPARNLFYSFCDKATSNSRIKNLIPQYGPILNSENNGGDFVFIRK